jgi:hypothetical protein
MGGAVGAAFGFFFFWGVASAGGFSSSLSSTPLGEETPGASLVDASSVCGAGDPNGAGFESGADSATERPTSPRTRTMMEYKGIMGTEMGALGDNVHGSRVLGDRHPISRY